MANTKTESSNNNGMNKTSSKMQDFGSSVEDASHKIGTNLGNIAGDLSDKTSDYIETTRSYVKEHPIQSVATAAAAGIIVGNLISMMRTNK